MPIILGDEVKDEVSGFKGIAVARHKYLQGCDRITVQPKVDKNGLLPEDRSFDEPQLKIIKKNKVTGNGDTTKGGPERFADAKKGTGNL